MLHKHNKFANEAQAKLAANECATTREWVEKNPGKHLVVPWKAFPVCLLCGLIQPRSGFTKPCPGIVRVGPR